MDENKNNSSSLKKQSFFRSAVWVLILFCLALMTQGFIINGTLNVIISTLERRFDLSSTSSGLIVSSYDIASFVVTLPISYFGSKGSKPKFLGVGLIVMGVGYVIFALPHFLTPSYDPNFAIPPPTNTSNTSFHHHQNGTEISSNSYLWMFILSQLLTGMGACPLWILGVTYFYENLSQGQSALFIGIYFACGVVGPALGILGCGELLMFATDWPAVGAASGLSPQHPNWVGNWWLGFLVGGGVAVCTGVLVACLPNSLKKEAEDQVGDSHEMNNANSDDNSNSDAPTEAVADFDFCSYKRDLLGLFRNVPFLLLSFTAAILALMSAGLNAFLFKYVELQFGYTASEAASVLGGLFVVVGALGMLMGGVVIKRFNMTLGDVIKMSGVFSVVTTFFFISFLIHCPSTRFHGVTFPDNLNGTNLKGCEASTTGSDSGCPVDMYEPVCGANKVLYYSPCHAGCDVGVPSEASRPQRRSSLEVKNNTLSNCTCVAAPTQTAVRSSCETTCSKVEPNVFIVLSIVPVFALFFLGVPIYDSILRCVNADVKSIAVGMKVVN